MIPLSIHAKKWKSITITLGDFFGSLSYIEAQRNMVGFVVQSHNINLFCGCVQLSSIVHFGVSNTSLNLLKSVTLRKTWLQRKGSLKYEECNFWSLLFTVFVGGMHISSSLVSVALSPLCRLQLWLALPTFRLASCGSSVSAARLNFSSLASRAKNTIYTDWYGYKNTCGN